MSAAPLEPTAARLAYTIPEAARVLGIGRTSMYGLIDAGEVPTVHIGRRRLVPHAALVAYLDRRLSEAA